MRAGRCTDISTATVLAAVLLGGAGDPVAGQTPLRIMPLGDSITQGDRDSYRRPLWLALKRAGIDADFVGSMRRGHGAESKARDFDDDHEGHWGWRADHVLAHVDTWAARAMPDIVLMHLGTNDVGAGHDINETVHEIARIIQRLRQQNPSVHILLAAIIPVDHERVTQRIKQFNKKLARLAATVDTPASRVVLVDQFTGFDAKQDTYDGTHPNDAGNTKIADNWFAALKALLSK